MFEKPIYEIVDSITAELFVTEQYTDESEAEAESWWLLEKLTGKTQAELLSNETLSLAPEQQATLQTWISQRTKDHKPIQYIIGNVPFCGLEILVEPPVLIPRPETEEWCAWLVNQLPHEEKLTILDLGAGSGCITLALAQELPYATIIGVDAHTDALRLCEKNKIHNNIQNAIFIKSDLYQELGSYKHTIDIIVSNPPYISPEEYETLSKDVTQWEDKNALVASDQGFYFHKKILADAHLYLKPKGLLVLECGKGQAEKLKTLFTQAGFQDIEIHKDLEGVERWISAHIRSLV